MRPVRCSAPARLLRKPRSIVSLLVDDVRTTGSTLSACAEALRCAGAADVRTLVLASRNFEEKSTKPHPARD
jgi:predicted amidophosphoribosyltransferase